MDIKGDTVTWRSSGRVEEVCGGIIGIGGQGAIVDEGWELMDINRNLIPNEGNPELTPVERQELADYMIEQWTRYRNGSPSIEVIVDIMKQKETASNERK